MITTRAAFCAWLAGCHARSAAPAGGAAVVHQRYEHDEAARMVPMLCEVLRFPTVAGNDKARDDQQAWLQKTAEALGFVVRPSGLVTEIELGGPEGAPVLGLLVHGDVQPVEAAKWTIPPFEGASRDGYVLGRGAADDKGPLVQALLAMKALRESGVARTHTIRLLVGSDEESANKDIAQYLATHRPPDYSLVLDSDFPVELGEKAWNLLTLATPLDERAGKVFPYRVVDLEAGLAPSIVPDQARIVLRWKTKAPDWAPLVERLRAKKLAEGTRLEMEEDRETLAVVVRGKSAHGGANLEGGRNALVALAAIFDGELPAGGANDLLGAARLAGRDLYGAGFDLTQNDPLWGRYAVNVATLKPAAPRADAGSADNADRVLAINLRRPPPLTGPDLKAKLEAWMKDLNARTGAHLVAGGFYDDEPLMFDPAAKIVGRLMAAYARATGTSPPPAISGGGTYAKRMPNSIAFGMWFPGAPYPGHDVDEKVPIADLHRGAHVLIEALVDLATAPPLRDPLKP